MFVVALGLDHILHAGLVDWQATTEGIAAFGREDHLARPGPAKILCQQRNPLALQPFLGKLGIALADGHQDRRDNGAAAKGLGDDSRLGGALAQHGIEQHLHGIVARQNDVGIVTGRLGAAGQQKMVHACQAQLGIVQADRDAGAQQRGDGALGFDGPAARIDVVGAALKILGVVVGG